MVAETEVTKMKNNNVTKRILYPAQAEIEIGLVLHYAIEIQENDEYATYIELSADEDHECEETEEVCIRIANPESARKLAYALSIFADAMEEDLGDETEDAEEEDEEEWPDIVRNEYVLRELEDMGISFEMEENDGGDE